MARTAPIDFELEAWGCGLRHVVGLDEVGCGPLAGPVVAGAVVLVPGSDPIEGIYDSKMLSQEEREAAAETIRRAALQGTLSDAVPDADRPRFFAFRGVVIQLGFAAGYSLATSRV